MPPPMPRPPRLDSRLLRASAAASAPYFSVMASITGCIIDDDAVVSDLNDRPSGFESSM